MERVPRSGEFYRHFKNKLYQILTVAEHSENGEKLVIYQALYGEFKTYARPLSMFVSEVDHQKYPEVTQKYRFEKVELSVENHCECVKQQAAKAEERKSDVEKTMVGQAAELEHVQAMVSTADTEAVQLATDDSTEKMMAFFDADDFEERYNILVSMRDSITDMQINNLAVSLDVVIPEGGIEERYEQLKMCLRTRQKYESNRLR